LVPHRRSGLVVQLAIGLAALLLAGLAWTLDPFWVELHGNALRCVTDPHELSLGNFARWIAAFSSVFLMFIVRPYAARLADRSGISIAGTARIALALILALVTSEVLLRKPWKAAAAPLACPICPPTIGNDRTYWQLAPSTKHVWQGPHDTITYFTDSDGSRVASLETHPDPNRPTIVVGGESIALGIGVNYEDTFAGVLERDLNVQVIDTGVFGYGMDQAYLREEDILPKVVHPIALITVFVPQQIERAELDSRNALVANDAGNLEMRSPLPAWFRDLQLRRLWRGLYHDDQQLRDQRAIARATVALAKQHGAYPLFVTTNFLEPCLPVRGQSPALFRVVFDDQGISRIHVDLPANQRVDGDPHPGPLSQLALAKAIEKALHDAHVL
jgi:hypothetical protein